MGAQPDTSFVSRIVLAIGKQMVYANHRALSDYMSSTIEVIRHSSTRTFPLRELLLLDD